MKPALLPENSGNGGFPEPPPNAEIRVVDARHDACGAHTRVRLPSTVPVGAVRRLHCAGCERTFVTACVQEIALERLDPAPAPAPIDLAPEPRAAQRPRWAPRPALAGPSFTAPKLPSIPVPRLPSLSIPALPPFDPSSRFWRLASIPIAALLVVGGLLLLEGGGDAPRTAVIPAGAAGTHAEDLAGAGAGAAALKRSGSGDSKTSKASKASKEAQLISGTGYSLALPAGWTQVKSEGGATFSAVSADGDADATLWITRDPRLDLPTFINQSLDQLQSLAGSARIVERVPAPTPEATIVRLAADPPPGQPSYDVTLRVSGPYRYYLATSLQPDASARASNGVKLIDGSFTPDVSGTE